MRLRLRLLQFEELLTFHGLMKRFERTLTKRFLSRSHVVILRTKILFSSDSSLPTYTSRLFHRCSTIERRFVWPRGKNTRSSYLEKGEKRERSEARNIWQQSRSCIFEMSADRERDQKYGAEEKNEEASPNWIVTKNEATTVKR